MSQPMIRTRVDQTVYDRLVVDAMLAGLTLAEHVRNLLSATPSVVAAREPTEAEWRSMKAWAAANRDILSAYTGPRDRATLRQMMLSKGWTPPT